MLFSTPAIRDHISGVILFDEYGGSGSQVEPSDESWGEPSGGTWVEPQQQQ
jgi:hypothetical protein